MRGPPPKARGSAALDRPQRHGRGASFLQRRRRRTHRHHVAADGRTVHGAPVGARRPVRGATKRITHPQSRLRPSRSQVRPHGYRLSAALAARRGIAHSSKTHARNAPRPPAAGPRTRRSQRIQTRRPSPCDRLQWLSLRRRNDKEWQKKWMGSTLQG